MGTYFDSIFKAIIFFPFVAFIFTMPYIIVCYKKYGSFLNIKVVFVYSFILYLMCAYFLVILPLPDRDVVAKLTTPKAQLIPFSFVYDCYKVIRKTGFMSLLTSPTLWQVLFNILMTVPFGMYLNYYFNLSFKKTLILSFCLSLFFELTQLSGLYFIYPRGYRLFDVDDLMLNTCGGMIGYLLATPLTKMLPSRQQMDMHSYQQGTIVSPLRRFSGFITDIIIIEIIDIILQLFFPGRNYYSYLVLPYFILISFILNGQTFGMKLVSISFSSNKKDKVSFSQCCKFYLILFGIIHYLPEVLYGIVHFIYENEIIKQEIYWSLNMIVFFIFLILLLFNSINIIRSRRTLYEEISDLKISSTIQF